MYLYERRSNDCNTRKIMNGQWRCRIKVIKKILWKIEHIEIHLQVLHLMNGDYEWMKVSLVSIKSLLQKNEMSFEENYIMRNA